MFRKWTKQEVIRFVICFAVFFVLVLATELPGFLSPLYWTLSPALSAFVTAGPITCVMNMKRGFGSAAAIPLLWFIVYRVIGEFSMPGMQIWIIAVIVIGEMIYVIAGHEKLSSIRIVAPFISLAPMGYMAPLFFQKAVFLEHAAAELDDAYVSALDRYGNPGMFVLLLALAVILAVVSERTSEKIMKIET